MIGYKIVRKIDGKLFSSNCYYNLVLSCAVEYKMNVWVYPHNRHCGPLAVFDTVENCYSFIAEFHHLDNNLEIYKCEYKKSVYNYLWTLQEKSHFSNVVHDGYCINRNLPPGTICAEVVKLIEKIKKDK